MLFFREGPGPLIVIQNNLKVALPRSGKKVGLESQVELINILDRSTEIVTMGALLSLRKDVYTVLDVCPDKVVVKRKETGEELDIVGMTEEERDSFLPRLLK